MRSRLLNVRQAVAALRAALLVSSIEAMDAQMPALQQAAATLEALRSESPRPESLRNESPEFELRREIEALARELRGSEKLIAQGLALTQGMAGLLAAATAGYRHDGEPAALRPSGTLLVRG
jgi:hypothetical protein